MNARPEMPAWIIRVRGAVQGVGFRPFVYREAMRLGIKGWVRNSPSGAEILAAGSLDALNSFKAAILDPHPPARVDDLEHEATTAPVPEGFSIAESNTAGGKTASILPDLATCPDCLREMNDPGNRRYRYPFTNCIACGPRYSILERIPYDRANTTMKVFAMCHACRAEYEDPGNRRFHAQPNACPECGPQIAFLEKSGHLLAEKDAALLMAAERIKTGQIIAIKGIGGFHLICDATNEDAILELRRRKHREEKPFAVMMEHLAMAEQFAVISEKEAQWLTSPAAPIVLLRPKGATLPGAIAPRNPWLGVFLPYSPLHHLLMQALKRPVIATSGNSSEEPICTDNQSAIERLGDIADFFLVHNRPIAHPVDDSVMRIVLDQPLMLRAARGFAPITLPAPEIAVPVLGAGAQMKVTVTLRHRDHMVVSPHIGDIENLRAEEAYAMTVEIMEQLHDAKPAHVVCDTHPDYSTMRFAIRKNVRPSRIQHHHAHVAAVMAEFGLAGPVLGVAWDGTGYGEDGTIWGGEFLRVDARGYQRIAHLRTFPLPGGDAAAREPRRSALGVLVAIGQVDPIPGFTESEAATLRQATQKGINTIQTSSAGRLFDAVSSLLGLCHKSTFEGQAAMLLQAEAEKITHPVEGYPCIASTGAIDWFPIITGLLNDRAHHIETSVIAARFHQSLIDLIAGTAALEPELPVVLCGGCFQNSWLLERTVLKLEAAGRTVYWPHLLPPNDGAISTGQVMFERG